MFNRKKPEGPRGEPLPEPNEGLPDTGRPHGLCPRCGKQSSFDVAGTLPVTFEATYIMERGGGRTPMIQDQVSSLICRNCQQGVVVVEEKRLISLATPHRSGPHQVVFQGIHWWPLPQAETMKDVPAGIAEAFAEAVTCLHAGAFRAAAVMARRALEGVTEDKGETTGQLHARLNSLSQKHILQPTLTDWGKEVRLIGNAGAHFDLGTKVEKADAEDLINLLRELLNYLYILPAELNRRRGKTT